MLFIQDKNGASVCRPEAVACGHIDGLIMCGEPQSAHTPEAARMDVGMDHKFKPATFDVQDRRDCGHDDWDRPVTFLGEEDTEQFSVTTRVNEEKIGEQQIHDPFIRTTVKLRGVKWAWKALFSGLKIQVCVDASEGASRAIMTLNPVRLKAETAKILEERRLSREAHAHSNEGILAANFTYDDKTGLPVRRKGHSALRWDKPSQTIKTFDPHPPAVSLG